MRWLVGTPRAGDCLFFQYRYERKSRTNSICLHPASFFLGLDFDTHPSNRFPSGHGGQTRARHGDERDGLNETLLPLDYKRAGQIEDDEINQLLVNREHAVGDDATRLELICGSRPVLVPQGAPTSPSFPPFSSSSARCEADCHRRCLPQRLR